MEGVKNMTYWEYSAAVTALGSDNDDGEFDAGAPPTREMIEAFRDKL